MKWMPESHTHQFVFACAMLWLSRVCSGLLFNPKSQSNVAFGSTDGVCVTALGLYLCPALTPGRLQLRLLVTSAAQFLSPTKLDRELQEKSNNLEQTTLAP